MCIYDLYTKSRDIDSYQGKALCHTRLLIPAVVNGEGSQRGSEQMRTAQQLQQQMGKSARHCGEALLV